MLHICIVGIFDERILWNDNSMFCDCRKLNLKMDLDISYDKTTLSFEQANADTHTREHHSYHLCNSFARG